MDHGTTQFAGRRSDSNHRDRADSITGIRWCPLTLRYATVNLFRQTGPTRRAGWN